MASAVLGQGQEQLFDLLMAHLRVGVLVTSADLTILAVSEVASRHLGKLRSELVGRSLNDLGAS